MERIKDGRRNILIHGNASKDDLPVSGLDEALYIAGTEPFVPANMDEPKVYPGDVLVGVEEGEIEFAELIYDKLDDGVLVVAIDTGRVEYIPDNVFSKRFYQLDEMHIYDDVTQSTPDWDVEFDESKLQRPEPGRAR